MANLSKREREVIEAMRASDRAEAAIYNYATSFAGDEQALDTKRLTGEYERSCD